MPAVPFVPSRGATPALVFALLGCIGCGSRRDPVWPDSGNGGDAGSLGDGASHGDGTAGGDGSTLGGTDVQTIPIDAMPDNCSDAARLVYVLSESNELYSFRPDLRMFTRIGMLDCSATLQPNSMAIDRNAVAWVNYVDSSGGFGDSAGSIYRVSTTDAHCMPGAPIDMPASWYRLGMGFSTSGPGSTDETLFVSATGDPLLGGGAGLGRIDMTTMRLVEIGPYSGSLQGESAELTGTGDGRLFGFFTTMPVQVAQIDKTSGSIVSTHRLSQVETPAAWAFSFWGGDFYLYTAPSATADPSRTSNVTRYRPSDGSVNAAYMTNVGFRIVGAGVSTCAPIQPPG